MRYFRKNLTFVTPAEREQLRTAFRLLDAAGEDSLVIIKRLTNDLQSTEVENIDRVANVRHLFLAIATAENPQQVASYLRTVDFLWDRRSFGITLADPESAGLGATANMRRVAGGSLDEMYELATAFWLASDRGWTPLNFRAFGRKVLLGAGGQSEADLWVVTSSARVLIDAKRTTRPGLPLGIGNVGDDYIARWARGLRDGDFDNVIIPTNGTPTDELRARIAAIFKAEGAEDVLDRIAFAFPAVPGF